MSTDTVKGIGRELVLGLLGVGICFADLNLAMPEVYEIMYSSPGFWIFTLSPYLGLQPVRSIDWALKSLKNPGE